MQGKAKTKWQKALSEVELAQRSGTTFKQAQIEYLKEISGVTNIGDKLVEDMGSSKKNYLNKV